MKALSNRLARLEGGIAQGLSERVKAWLGQRPPLTPEEEAREPHPDLATIDTSGWSPRLREWLGV